jgi:micrococcal nuclease
MKAALAQLTRVTLSLALLIAVWPTVAAAQQAVSATVTRVVDGDTVIARGADGTESSVRLIGIDTPESVKPGTAVECGARAAAQTLRELVEGEAVTLTSDPTQDRVDAFGRLLAYVDVGAIDAGEAMIRAGYSRVYVFENRPFQRIAAYRQAEQAAKSQDVGVWRDCAGNFHSTDEPVNDVDSERKESAEAFVRRYYSRISRRQFGLAWSMLSASQKRRFGRYSGWRAGYRRSLGTRVNQATVQLLGARAVLRVAIRSRDRDACSGREVRQFFRVRWVLSRSGGQWVATSVSARKVGGGRVRVSKSQCAKPKPKPSPKPQSPSGGGGGGSGGGCHPSYTPCVPTGRDYDCGELSGPYTVRGPDEYRLDGDNDGVGCE